jgi:hypothetical protein
MQITYTSLALYVCFVDRCLSFCTFFLAIVLSVLLRYTDSHYPSGMFKLFFDMYGCINITGSIPTLMDYHHHEGIISQSSVSVLSWFIRYTGYRRRTDNTMAKKKVQKDKQRSAKHIHTTKDRVTRTPLKTGGGLRCPGRVRQ